MKKHLWKATALAALLFAATSAFAAGPLVSVIGSPAAESTAAVHEFDLSRLDGMRQTTLTTKVPPLPGIHEVRGVLVREVLQSLNLKGTVVSALGLDGYSVDIPVEDFIKYDVVIATRIDGKTLSVRDKGPGWIVYPMSQHAELDDPVVEAKSVWQLKSLTVK